MNIFQKCQVNIFINQRFFTEALVLDLDFGPNACATFLRLQLVTGEWRGLDGNPLIYALSKFVKLTIE